MLLAFDKRKKTTSQLNVYTFIDLRFYFSCVYFSALYAAPATPGPGGGAGYSSGIFGAASLQTRVMALQQEAQVAPLTMLAMLQ